MNIRVVVVLSIVALTGSTRAQSQSALTAVNIVVGFSPGGGTDTYARLLGRHIGNHIPGDPKVTVQNMPGSGSLKAVQSLATPSAPGTISMVTFNYGLITESQFNPEQVRTKLTDYKWIGSLDSVPAVCFSWAASGIKTLDDLRKRTRFNIGAPAVGSSNHVNGMLLKNVARTPTHVVTGYPGSADERIAIERGELDGGCGAWSSIPPDWIRNGSITPLVSFSTTPVAGLPPGVPFIGDVASGEQEKQLVNLLIGPSALGRPFIVSADTSAQVMAILQTGFEGAAKDPHLLQEASKMKLPINVVSGAEAEKLVAAIYATSVKVISDAKALVR